MATIKSIHGVEYQETPNGVIIPRIAEGSPATVLGTVSDLPPQDRLHIRNDSPERYQIALDDPIGYLRNKMCNDLLYLMHDGLGFPDISPKFRYQRELEEFYSTDDLRKLVCIPRWHFKTTFGVGLIAQDIVTHPNNTWLIGGATWDMSYTIMNMLMKRLRTSSMQLVWGDLMGDTWGAKGMNVKTKTEDYREPTCMVAGIGTEITGLHPKNALLDDLVGESNYETPEKRQSVKDYYEYLMFIITNAIVMNATRWHFDDLVGYILEKNKSLLHDHPMRYRVYYKSVYDDFGNPLFPEKYDIDWIENKRVEMASYKFACQMMNNPLNPDDQVFRNEDLEPYYWTELPKELLASMNYFIAVDPAASQAKYADFTAIVVCGVTSSMDIYVVEYVNKKMSTSETINQIFRLVKKWKPMKKVGIEQGTLRMQMYDDIKDRQRFSNTFFSLKELKYGSQPGSRGRSKPERILSLQPLVENGMIHLGRHMLQLQEQMLTYPACRHDDLVDALAYMRQMIYPPGPLTAPSSKTLFQKMLEKKRGRRKGRNFDTAFLNEEAQ